MIDRNNTCLCVCEDKTHRHFCRLSDRTNDFVFTLAATFFPGFQIADVDSELQRMMPESLQRIGQQTGD
jgi:hypothetical protein